MAPTKSFIVMIGIVASGVSACDNYMDRRDQVTFGTGDSIAANRAAQIIDPWPVAARTIDHGIDAERAESALRRMRRASAGTSQEGRAGSSPTSAPPAAQQSPTLIK